jgi:hypothetical protein
MENEKPLRDLSRVLEKQLETVLANQDVLLAMHGTLKQILPTYASEFAKALEVQRTAKTRQQDANTLWIANARSVISALRR